MKKKFSALIVLFLLVLPGSANALETNELIALTAMPLAVAAVADLADVPTSELVTVVSTLNHAAVPPTQFVEIVRYTPVAFVDTTEPRFVTYVTTEYNRGLVGNELAYSIADRFPTYGVREINVIDPPIVTTVVEREILPPVVVTRFQPVSVDPLALIAMPLAVAAVSEMTDVPRSDLISFITAMNRAMVPAPQFVEVVRYSPVMLVDRREAPLFLSFVTSEIDRGVIGRPLAFSIANRMETMGIDEIDILDPPTAMIVDRDDVFIPPVVVTRVADVRSHPHGGPPGQLKKDLGLQTGAEVVHGTRPSSRTTRPRAARSAARDDGRPAKPKKVRGDRQRVTKAPDVRPGNRGRDRGETRVTKPRKQSPPSAKRPDSGSRGKGRVSKPSGSGGGAKQGNPGKGKGKGKG